jgi:hypothetical protein
MKYSIFDSVTGLVILSGTAESHEAIKAMKTQPQHRAVYGQELPVGTDMFALIGPARRNPPPQQ